MAKEIEFLKQRAKKFQPKSGKKNYPRKQRFFKNNRENF